MKNCLDDSNGGDVGFLYTLAHIFLAQFRFHPECWLFRHFDCIYRVRRLFGYGTHFPLHALQLTSLVF